MTRVYVELSGESTLLGAAESIAAAEALGGAAAADDPLEIAGLVAIDLAVEEDVDRLTGRLALARRCLTLLAEPPGVERALQNEGRGGRSAAVRRLGSPTASATDSRVLAAGGAYKSGGGSIDLGNPERRFWLVQSLDGEDRLLEECSSIDRAATGGRRMPTLPFQRPVSLPPRLARAAANLARVRPGDRVVDPFIGTGALLAEAGLLQARLYGIDRDAAMVRGALRNMAHLGVVAEELIVGDAGEAEFGGGTESFDAVLTDPPYGRASSTGGEGAAVVDRVLPRWASRVRPGGRVVVVVSAPIQGPGPDWKRVLAVPIRVHRSLTREFQVYERDVVTPTPA